MRLPVVVVDGDNVFASIIFFHEHILFHSIDFTLAIALWRVFFAVPLPRLGHVVLLPHFLFRGARPHQHLFAALQTTLQQKILRHIDDDKFDARDFLTHKVRIAKQVVNCERQNHILACFDSFLVLLKQELKVWLPLVCLHCVAFLGLDHGLVQHVPNVLHLGILG